MTQKVFNSLDQLVLNHKLLEKIAFYPFFPTLRSHEFHRMTLIIYKENALQKAPIGINETHTYLFIKLF